MTNRKWVRTEINTRTVNPLLLGNAYSNIDRNTTLSNLSALTTQVMLSTALPLVKGAVVTNLTFVSATTGAGTPTNWWFALYDPDGNLISQTADQTNTAWAGSTAKTLALPTPHMTTSTGVYRAAIMVKATTVPTLAGVSLLNTAVAGALAGVAKIASQTSGSALTTTAPAAIATPTTVVNVPLVIAS
jgi:hypothetical protein